MSELIEGRADGWMKVRVSFELAATLFVRDEHGNRLRVDWGKPDDDGFYVPTITPDTTDSLLDNLCGKLTAWAEAAKVIGPRGAELTQRSLGTEPYALHSRLTVSKSDLLGRLIYGREQAPSDTPCPVHQGKWTGIHSGWPGDWWYNREGPVRPVEESKMCREWWDAGCRCFLHRGSNGTTGWQPDAACGCLGRIAEREAKVLSGAA